MLKTPHIRCRFINLVLAVIFSVMVSGCEEAGDGPLMEAETIEVSAVDTIPDFEDFDSVKEKKKRFFDFMRPLIEAENARVLKQRKRFLRLYAKHQRGEEFSPEEESRLQKLIKEYRANRVASSRVDIWEVLRRRIDIIPVPLALVQAANESGWGTSRFARLGNNMFGQWCFEESCGIVPRDRIEGKNHRVAKYETVNRSVRSYIRNINTSHAYREFRELRMKQRENGQKLDSYRLVEGLLKYSSRREDYLAEIRAMLRVNAPLFKYDIGDTSLYAEARPEKKSEAKGGAGKAQPGETAAAGDKSGESRISE